VAAGAEAPAAPAAAAEAPAAAVGAAAVAAGAAAAEAEAPVVEEAPAAAVAAAGEAVAAEAEPAPAAAALKQIEAGLGAADLGNLREKVDFIEGVGPAYAAKLNEIGVVTVMDLLQRGATRKGRAELVEATGIAAGLILKWINHADLFRITGVGKQFGELLEAAGVDTVVELAQRNPVNLFSRLAQVNAEKKLAGRAPRQDEVSKWVEQAKGLPRVVEY
jgi:predicted flap endonuclease-1-like 5' DNA nuclease